MRREHGHSTGRSNLDHPDTARQHRQEVARLAVEDRRRQLREDEDEQRILVGTAAGVVDNGHDSYDRPELDYQLMQREERGQPHPNEWAR
jgi:hypothetical protein